METNNNNMMFREEQHGGYGWLWWVVALLVILGLLWFFLGRGNKTPETFDGSSLEVTQEYGDDVEFDEYGLPILGPQASISTARIEIAESFPVQVTLVVSGELADGCTYLNTPAQGRKGTTFYVSLSTRTEGEVCTQALVPFERRIGLDVTGLPAGSYTVNVNGQVLGFDIQQENTLNFQAGSDK